MVHWIIELADKLEKRVKGKKGPVIFNGGLSVSGLQHIGRLRGEVLIGEGVRKVLEKRGYKTRQYIVLYTQDAWKGTEEQLKAFGDVKKGRMHIGKPLIRVPDPFGCHSNWVEHYWEDFGGVLDLSLIHISEPTRPY
jgi:lysyl-tRNA synthetase class 1